MQTCIAPIRKKFIKSKYIFESIFSIERATCKSKLCYILLMKTHSLSFKPIDNLKQISFLPSFCLSFHSRQRRAQFRNIVNHSIKCYVLVFAEKLVSKYPTVSWLVVLQTLHRLTHKCSEYSANIREDIFIWNIR